MIRYDDLIALFEWMYKEHWPYEWGAAREGCVDCSGAFVYAYKRLGGPGIAHGSNTILRTAVGPTGTTPMPGYAAFKVRHDGGEPKKYWNDGLGNAYHIGLVAADGKHVLNAKGEAYGFCRDSAEEWTYFAPLAAVNYHTGEDVRTMETDATVVTQSGKLNVRTAAGANAAIVGKLDKGERVRVLWDAGDGWLYIQLPGRYNGFVSAAYIRRDGEESAETPDGSEGVTAGADPASLPGPPTAAGSENITIIDDAGNRFCPQGGFRVLVGAID